VVVGSLSDPLLNNAYRIRVRGSFAFLSAKNSSVVAAIDVSNPSAPHMAGYVQDAGHLYSTSGLDLDSTGRYVIANSPMLSTETSSAYPPFPTTTGTISVISLDPSPLQVTIGASSKPGDPTVSHTANFSFVSTDDVSAVSCSLDGAAYAPCTSATTQSYGSLGVGSHTFTVRTTDPAGDTASDTYTWTVNSGSVPQNQVPPSNTGTGSGSGSVTSPTTATPTRTACVVPKLRRMTLAQAKRSLVRAHCRAGRIRRPKTVRAHYILRISGQSARTGTRHSPGYRVNVVLSTYRKA
jgi:hypothetical protein